MRVTRSCPKFTQLSILTKQNEVLRLPGLLMQHLFICFQGLHSCLSAKESFLPGPFIRDAPKPFYQKQFNNSGSSAGPKMLLLTPVVNQPFYYVKSLRRNKAKQSKPNQANNKPGRAESITMTDHFGKHWPIYNIYLEFFFSLVVFDHPGIFV